ncbi:MAG: hypothetical protein ACR2MF_06965 [Chthoniobacterales bacterium]
MKCNEALKFGLGIIFTRDQFPTHMKGLFTLKENPVLKLAIALLALSGALVDGASAATFSDDFLSGLRPAYWTTGQTTAGLWSVDDKQGDVRLAKVGTSPGGFQNVAVHLNMAAVGGPITGDFSTQVDFRNAVVGPNQDQVELHVIFQDSSFFLTVYQTGPNVHVWDGAEHGTTAVSANSGTFTISRSGSTVTGYYNGSPIFSKTDASAVTAIDFTNQLQPGSSDNTSVTFDNFSLTAASVPGPAPTLLGNLSTRLRVETGDNALFGGFIVTGNQPKRLIVRAIGPSLNGLVPDALQNPTLELYSGQTLIASNDNWVDAANKQEIIDSTLAPKSDFESAILTSLVPGPYTAIVRGVNGTTGVGLVEVYDLGQTADSQLAQISTRGFVQTGDNVMFGGFFVVNGDQKVIIRAIGPSLTRAGVANALQDPTMELRDGNGTLLEANDNWVDSPNKQAIIDTTVPPSNDFESAILRTLPPGGYTAIVRGKGATPTGIALVEVYALK